ncbi:endonuclease/exonuclease/phosphatase family protein [Flavobacterium hibisci]|uniref:endonuclease/exonuclease/phosphatase family protein n=1 Tax=Flavobacterium hibisci TaxID=1914462 RepID=UPI001CBBD41E|nr:endonuclease/exonuclease/phosphatase family protein [Flavobacterium hibisci]MBZ4041046.1 endonuclease/exonuclease/phosphatase family protein [Flavobacterium hibisci]
MQYFFFVLSIILVIITFIPLIKNEYWIFRVCDYPRLQKLVLTTICIVFLAFYSRGKEYDFNDLLLLIMVVNACYLLRQILPFTGLGKKHVQRITTEIPENGFSVMISNVYQFNTNYKGCLEEIHKANPDVVLLLETHAVWEKETNALEEHFPFYKKVPLENTYGMLLYSKLELLNTEVKYLVENDIPSIHTQIILPGGQAVQMYAVHPEPPVPMENPTSKERDKELLLVADLAKDSDLPVIVIGDLNDVAWSYTTELFLKMSGLLDPRRGRGFYNSFHAHYPFLRFPLDHAFISTHLKIREMKRLDNFGSDHFPIFISLQYETAAELEQDEMQPDSEDIAIAEEKKAAD